MTLSIVERYHRVINDKFTLFSSLNICILDFIKYIATIDSHAQHPQNKEEEKDSQSA
jgi:hypothetical protein